MAVAASGGTGDTDKSETGNDDGRRKGQQEVPWMGGVFDVHGPAEREHHGEARITKGGDAPSQLEDGTSPLAEDDGTDKRGNGNDGGRQHEEDKGKQDAQRVELETENVGCHRRHEKGGGQRPKADGAPDGVKEDVEEVFHGSRVSG